MLVSVVIPVFNGRAHVARAIESVRQQTLEDIELIVVDDASTDGTGDHVRALLAGMPNSMLVELDENSGPSAARNAGFERANGRWIAILDADDYFLPDRLERLVQHAENRALDFVADSLSVAYDPDEPAPPSANDADAVPRPWNFYEHFDNDYPGIEVPYGLLKPVFCREFLERVGKRYDEGYRNGEDFYFYAELFLAGGRAEILPYRGYVYLSRYCTYQHGTVAVLQSLTRPTRDPATLVEQSDRLVARHEAELSPLQRKLIQRRRRRLMNSKHLYDVKKGLRERPLNTVIFHLIRYPPVWKSIVIFAFRLIRQRLASNRIGSLHEASAGIPRSNSGGGAGSLIR
jgi:succinoglycan biosynthesis protein ExoO